MASRDCGCVRQDFLAVLREPIEARRASEETSSIPCLHSRASMRTIRFNVHLPENLAAHLRADGLHPNVAGARITAEGICKAVANEQSLRP